MTLCDWRNQTDLVSCERFVIVRQGQLNAAGSMFIAVYGAAHLGSINYTIKQYKAVTCHRSYQELENAIVRASNIRCYPFLATFFGFSCDSSAPLSQSG